MRSIIEKNRKVSLYQLCLTGLVLNSEISKIFFFSQLDFFSIMKGFVEIMAYAGLIYVIIHKKYSIKQLMLIAVLAMILLAGYIHNGMSSYFRSLLLILASKDVLFPKIVHTIRSTLVFSLALSVLLFLAGVSDSGVTRRGYIALGYEHPNVLAEVIFIIFMLWLAEYASVIKKNKMYAVIFAMAASIFVLTGSRTPSVLLILFPILSGIVKFGLKKNKESRLMRIMGEVSQSVVILVTYLTALLLPNRGWIQAIDLLVNNRIFLNYYALNKYGIKLFGQAVTLQDTGVYNNVRGLYNWDTTVDSTYMTSMIVMGLIPTVICAFGFFLAVRKGFKQKNYVIVSIAVILVIYGFYETHLMEVYNNFIYFYIAAMQGTLGVKPQYGGTEHKNFNGKEALRVS